MKVSNIEEYRKIAFFNHILLAKTDADRVQDPER